MPHNNPTLRNAPIWVVEELDVRSNWLVICNPIPYEQAVEFAERRRSTRVQVRTISQTRWPEEFRHFATGPGSIAFEVNPVADLSPELNPALVVEPIWVVDQADTNLSWICICNPVTYEQASTLANERGGQSPVRIRCLLQIQWPYVVQERVRIATAPAQQLWVVEVKRDEAWEAVIQPAPFARAVAATQHMKELEFRVIRCEPLLPVLEPARTRYERV